MTKYPIASPLTHPCPGPAETGTHQRLTPRGWELDLSSYSCHLGRLFQRFQRNITADQRTRLILPCGEANSSLCSASHLSCGSIIAFPDLIFYPVLGLSFPLSFYSSAPTPSPRLEVRKPYPVTIAQPKVSCQMENNCCRDRVCCCCTAPDIRGTCQGPLTQVWELKLQNVPWDKE